MDLPLRKTFDCPPVPRLRGDRPLFKDGVLVGVRLDACWRPRALLARARILVVDDMKDLAELYALKLRTCGFDASCVFDGAAGLASAKRNPPDLMLLNLMMPGLTGYEVLSRLRADPATKAVKVVMTSVCFHSPHHTAQAIEMGADDCLPVPFGAGALLEKVTGVLRPRRPRD